MIALNLSLMAITILFCNLIQIDLSMLFLIICNKL